jgi:hypothetical protein
VLVGCSEWEGGIVGSSREGTNFGCVVGVELEDYGTLYE